MILCAWNWKGVLKWQGGGKGGVYGIRGVCGEIRDRTFEYGTKSFQIRCFGFPCLVELNGVVFLLEKKKRVEKETPDTCQSLTLS